MRSGADGTGDDNRCDVEIDLHGLRPEQAQRRLEQELHSGRVQGAFEVLVITGRGWGNQTHEPILRKRMEAWLRGPQGRERG